MTETKSVTEKPKVFLSRIANLYIMSWNAAHYARNEIATHMGEEITDQAFHDMVNKFFDQAVKEGHINQTQVGHYKW